MFEAVIFDLDGLPSDSAPFWGGAGSKVCGRLGSNVTEDHARITRRWTTKEVTGYWYNLQPWEEKGQEEVASAVVESVAQMIEEKGAVMDGVNAVLQFFRQQHFKIGLATNSPLKLIAKVLSKLDIATYFDAVSSAEFEQQGKPRPDVYLAAARKLKVHPTKCLAFEDSKSGMEAARAAGMKVVVVPDKSLHNDIGFDAADLKISCLDQFCRDHILLLSHNVKRH